MSEEDSELLSSVHELTKENNRMIKKLYRSYRWSQMTRMAYWAVIIILALTGYYFAQPYLEKVKVIYDDIQKKLVGTSTSTQ